MEIDEHIEAAAKAAQESAKASQEAFDSATSARQSVKECLQDSLEVLESVRATLTDEDDIKDLDARITETQARIADLEDN